MTTTLRTTPQLPSGHAVSPRSPRLPRRTRRIVAGLAVGLFAGSAVLTGCSSAGAADSGDQVALTYWLWDSGQLPGYQQCATDFEAANPDILINIEQYGWGDYWTQLTARMVAENAPDVFTDHTQQFGKFVDYDQLLDIEPLIAEDDLDLSIYQDGLASLWEGPDGGVYGLPKDWDTEGLFYNVEMLEAAGYTPEDLWTLEWNPVDGGTFEQFLARMTIDKNGVRGDEEGFNPNSIEVFGMGYGDSGGGYGQVQWSTFALGNDWVYADESPWPTVFNYGQQNFIDTIAWYTGLIEKGYMPSFAQATSGIGATDALAAGGYATLVEGSWNARNLVEREGVELQVAPTPIGPSGQRASVLNGLGDSIWVGTEHPDEAWRWVAYLASPECQMVVGEQARVFPAITEATDVAVEAFNEIGVDAEAFAVHLEEGTGVNSPVVDQWAQLQTIMTPAMDAIFAGSASPDSLVGANDRVNALW